jgi:hypothetical protein
MQMNGAPPTLLRRIVDLLRAKQFLVFYAIGLTTLAYAAALLTAWLREHHPLEVLIGGNLSPVGDAFLRRSAPVVLVALLYYAVSAWLTAGFWRSLLGRLHWGPRDARQFVRLLALGVFTDALGWAAFAALPDKAGDAVLGVALVWAIVSVALTYASIAVIVSGSSVPGSLVQAWRATSVNPMLVLAMGLLSLSATIDVWLLLPFAGDFAGVLPSGIILVTVAGSVAFVVDAVLFMVYVDAIEKRRVPHEP